MRAEQVKLAPQLGAAMDIGYLIGMGAIDERMLILVDIDQLMSGADIGFNQTRQWYFLAASLAAAECGQQLMASN